MCSVMGAMMGLQLISGINQNRQIKQQTAAQVSAYNAQAQAADQNARIMDRQREQIAENYAQQQEKLNSKRKLILGQQAASAGASGLDNIGSVLDANSAAISEYRKDSMNLLGNQRNDTLDAYINQVNYENQASAARASAANAKAQGKSQRLANFISTAAGMFGAYKQFAGASLPKPAGMNMRTGFEGSLSGGNLTYTTPAPMYTRNAMSTGFTTKVGLTQTKDIIGQGIGKHYDPWRSIWRKQ